MLDPQYVERLRNSIRTQPKSERDTSLGQLKQLIAEFDEDASQTCNLCEGTGLARTQISPVYRAGTDLIQYLRQQRKPTHITRCKPGEAPRRPEETRWICSLCIGDKHIKTRTNDLRGHLEKDHLCCKQDLNHVFDKKNPGTLWDYFGPCTEEQAFQNGWDVRPFRETKKKHGSGEVSGKGFSKSIHNIGDTVKRTLTFGASRSNSDLEKSIENLAIRPRANITTSTDMSGLTYVQPIEPSLTTATFYSATGNIHQELSESHSALQYIPNDHDHLADSLELGKQFASASNALVLPNFEPSNHSWSDLDFINDIPHEESGVPMHCDQPHFDGWSSPMDILQSESHYHSDDDINDNNLDATPFNTFLWQKG